MTLERRAFLSLITCAPALRAQRPGVELTVRLDDEIGVISPLIYGQFTEHIGRLIYEGIWVGKDSSIPNKDGYRLDTVNALKRVRPPVFRWPGGCFADAYHWEDGVGPERRAHRNHWWLREEPNTFGTGEFIPWCRLLDAEPYLSVNVGSGTVQEALNWLEYCNGPANIGYGAKRAANGHSEPYGVQWWGIGNENWGCGGLFSAEEYAQQFRQYAIYFKRFGLTTDVQLVAAGHNEPGFNATVLQNAGGSLPYLDHISFHRYFRRGHSTNFTDAEYLDLMLDLTPFEELITESIQAIEAVEPMRERQRIFGPLKPKPIGLIIDEWGVWHSDAELSDGFSQKGVLREALFAASALNLFHQYVPRITMTNIAQVVNCLHSLLNTDGAKMTLTPTFHVYEMYQPHYGATSVKVSLEAARMLHHGARSRPTVSVSASKSGDSVLVTLVNLAPEQASDVVVRFRGGKAASAKARNLTGESVRAMNTPDNPDAVRSKEAPVIIEDGALKFDLPAHSVQAVRVNLG